MDILDTVQIFSVSMEFSIKGHLYLVGFKDFDGFFVQRNWQRRTRILRILALQTRHRHVIAVWMRKTRPKKRCNPHFQEMCRIWIRYIKIY